MSWNDFYRRRDVIDATLRQARRNPDGAVAFEEIPHAAEVFTGTEELLAALHYKWTQLLTGHIGLALSAAEQSPNADRVEAVASAWRRAANENQALRRVLEANAGPALDAANAREQRMLALSAGLAELTEPAEEIERIGAAFLALVHSTPAAPSRTTGKRGLARLLG
ncbi:hypothetical protein GCM10010174_58190 [Kutzneria viridogrisea]|uniref:Uncharacterized protein n=2 Tax=Kutzneria TaxID=43356 RepID=W5W4B0_9PSEU|nr:hypothetical protein [Kutzneria albida]AHH95306.1 hypothetical protein KALB_1936 [Kutzneria albida DSM 43870]MBA8927337.1 NADH dehydrogenase/NADH:ubiquinone oxidoreductase subunit G [Kutzneria viridogrisea]